MTKRWRACGPVAFAIVFAAIPLFPSFITLTSVPFPGVSVVPLPLALTVLALMGALAVWAIGDLALFPARSVPLLFPLLGWIVACILATVFGFNPRDGSVFLGILGLSLLWYVSLVRNYEAPNVARASLWAFVVSGVAACIVALAMVSLRMPAAQYTIAHGRAVGTFVLPGELAGYLIFFIPIAYGLSQSASSGLFRRICWFAFGLGAITMFFTFSRTGWVGLASAAGVFVAVRARERQRGILAAGAIVAAVLVLVLALFNEHHNPSEDFTRISIWQATGGVIDRFPLLGVGPFGFSRIYPLVRLPDGDATAFHAHSMYLTFLAETGIVGFGAYVWVLWAWASEMRRRFERAAVNTTLSLAIAAGLAGTLVQGLIDTVSVVIFGMFLPMLALALMSAQRGTGDA